MTLSVSLSVTHFCVRKEGTSTRYPIEKYVGWAVMSSNQRIFQWDTQYLLSRIRQLNKFTAPLDESPLFNL